MSYIPPIREETISLRGAKELVEALEQFVLANYGIKDYFVNIPAGWVGGRIAMIKHTRELAKTQFDEQEHQRKITEASRELTRTRIAYQSARDAAIAAESAARALGIRFSSIMPDHIEVGPMEWVPANDDVFDSQTPPDMGSDDFDNETAAYREREREMMAVQASRDAYDSQMMDDETPF